MRIDNEQNTNEAKQKVSRNGAAGDDKSKEGDFGRTEEAAAGAPEPRGGSTIDDRSKQFGPVDHPKA